jgi:hypothetical protein
MCHRRDAMGNFLRKMTFESLYLKQIISVTNKLTKKRMQMYHSLVQNDMVFDIFALIYLFLV